MTQYPSCNVCCYFWVRMKVVVMVDGDRRRSGWEEPRREMREAAIRLLLYIYS